MTDDTSIGGAQRAFPTTLWSSLIRGRGPDPVLKRQTMEKLLVRYWKPVYSCIRFGWNKSGEDAKDFVQDFFVDLLERDFLKDISPEKGRFRSFLKAALKNYMMNEKRDAARLKRGGGAAIVPLEGIEDIQATPGDPDKIFDEEWTRSVIGRAIDELRNELTQAGKEDYYKVFLMYDLGQGEPSYRSIAKEIGRSESDVRNYLHHARQAIRRIVIRQVSEYALDEHDVEEELQWILG